MALEEENYFTEYSGDERVVAVLHDHAWVEGRWVGQQGRCTCGWQQRNSGKLNHPVHVAAKINTALGIIPEQHMPDVATEMGTGLVYRRAASGRWYLLDFVAGEPLDDGAISQLISITPVDMRRFRA